ncbi:MAG: DUF4458 domain-containing protein [Candidatus Cryptobacteroides sp.]
MAGFLLAFSGLLSLASCVRESLPDNREKDYGNVQFMLFKEASYQPSTKGLVPQLEYLSQAGKIQVNLKYGDSQLSQTLTLSSADKETAEFGLKSEMIQLLGGEYQVESFVLYDVLDQAIYIGTVKDVSFTVIPGGLEICDLTAKVKPRGKVRFKFVKDFVSKASSGEYTFDEIKYVNLTLRKDGSADRITFKNLKTKFVLDFDGENEDNRTSYLVCDTLLSIPAGTYRVHSYETCNSSKSTLEANTLPEECAFTVEDNETTEADIKIALKLSDEYLKDYVVLKDIWESLGGEDWYYSGQDFREGANWNFNKDIDLWGDQPGVELHSNGRVASINLSDFGFYGDLPASIKQLTELAVLYLGTHNDLNLLNYDPTVGRPSGMTRMEAHKQYLKAKHPATQMSEPVARALMEHNISIPEIEMYNTMKEDEIIEKGTGRMRVKPMDIVHGQLCNGLTSIPEEIKYLKNLEQLFIANGKIKTIPDGIGELEKLTDLEIYNCPEMKEFPMAITRIPSLESLNISNNLQLSAAEMYNGLKAFASGASSEVIQILYCSENNLEVVPEEFRLMKKIGLLDLSNNKIREIEKAFGKDVNPVQLYLSNNQLESIPNEIVDGKHIFCGFDDVESLSFSNNKLTKFPDIFDAQSKMIMKSVDFSFNNITEFEKNGTGNTYQGIRSETVTLSNNPLGTFPLEFAQSNSLISNLNIRGCQLNSIPEGSFQYKNAINLLSIDFSYNNLTSLPKEFNSRYMPYFYGIDLSFNRFSKFPFEPLDSAYLTVFGIRSQRDANGNRCLSEWPTGIYNHKGLRGFYIGSNDLRKIDDTISTLCYYLDISDNPNIVFDASDICSAYRNGQFFLIYDKTQDIRNCEIMKN